MRETTTADYARRLLDAQRYIEEHLDEQLSPLDIARVAGFSVHHFHRIFRAQLGESVMQRTRRLRLERAARELRSGDSRLLDVALRAGYDSHEAFTRAFIERFEVAPSSYREQPSLRLREWVQRGSEGPRSSVEVRTCARVHGVFARHLGGYEVVGQTWGQLIERLSRAKRFDASTKLYGLCPDDPEVTDTQHLRFDACAAVAGPLEGLGTMHIAAGVFAVAVHVGPYETLGQTYLDVIGHWAPTSGYELATGEPVVEHYLNDPTITKASELRTEVRVRLAE